MNVFLTSSDAGFYLISQNSTSVFPEVIPPQKKHVEKTNQQPTCSPTLTVVKRLHLEM